MPLLKLENNSSQIKCHKAKLSEQLTRTFEVLVLTICDYLINNHEANLKVLDCKKFDYYTV